MRKLIATSVISILFLSACSGKPVPNEKLQLKVGETVELTGKLSNQPWQHMIDIHPEYPYIAYVDFDDGDQLVVYTKELAECNGEFGFKGTVIQIEGESEIQVLADETTCN